MTPAKKVVQVDWKQCDALPQAPTDQHTQIQVKKASIPLVFVPGIMGSRLERGDKSFCWDPDSSSGMWWNYSGVGGGVRKQFLIDNPNKQGTRRVMAERNGSDTEAFKKVLRDLWIKTHWVGKDEVNAPNWTWMRDDYAKLQGKDRVEKMVELAVSQGWMEVAWGFYGDFILRLASTTFQEFKRIFHHPVYAVGYDWVGDNKLAGEMLTHRIAEIKAKEKTYNRECEKVIIISHSMGGLASRASVVDGVAGACSKADVLGVIHGAQPSTGAPAAYRRMRAGFEPGPNEGYIDKKKRGVLGFNSSQVVPVLGGCIGGLELLPTKLYTWKNKQGADEKLWLFQKERDGSVGEKMPQSGDPYKEIYSEDKDFLRLVFDPNLLDPWAQPTQKKTRRSSAEDGPMSKFLRNLGAAESFHDALKDQVHPATFITWGSDHGLGTYEQITWTQGGLISTEEIGAGTDMDPHPPDGSQGSWYHLNTPDGPGDQTVPSSSGSMLLKNSLNAKLHDAQCKPVDGAMKGYEHSAFYNDADVMHFVKAAVQELSFQFREDTIGK